MSYAARRYICAGDTLNYDTKCNSLEQNALPTPEGQLKVA